MARSFNQVTLVGNLTRDPEVRQIPSGQNVCNFSLALNRSYKDASGEWKDAADYIDIVAWAELGDRVAQWLKKGSQCLVNGRLQQRTWEQDGQKRSKVEVVANEVIFLGGNNDGQAKKEAKEAKPAEEGAKTETEEIGNDPISLDSIPF